MNTPLRFINIKRVYDNSQDGASLSVGGRTGKPGLFGVVGGLEHSTFFGPATEVDRKAMISILESEECKAFVAST